MIMIHSMRPKPPLLKSSKYNLPCALDSFSLYSLRNVRLKFLACFSTWKKVTFVQASTFFNLSIGVNFSLLYVWCSLEGLDEKRMTFWKGQHPTKYSEPSEKAFSVRSNRSKSISIKSFAPGQSRTIQHGDRMGTAEDGLSVRSRSSAISKKQKEITSRLRMMQKSGEELITNGSLTAKARKDLREILQENQLYEDVIE